MRINKITNCVLASALITASTSCSKKPFKQMSKDRIPPMVERKIDSLAKQSKEVLKDTTYKYFGKDTLRLSDTEASTKQIQKKMDRIAKEKDKSVVVGSHLYMMPVCTGKSTTLIPQWRNDYAKSHINQKAIVKDAKVFTTDSTDIYIPVEYYGQINPETLNKKCR